MSEQPAPREWKRQHVARIIANHSNLSHDWEDFIDAVRALDRHGLLDLSTLDAPTTPPAHFVVHEERPRDDKGDRR
jgi:hypothetical protein